MGRSIKCLRREKRNSKSGGCCWDKERALTLPCPCAQVFSSGSWPPFRLTVPGLSAAFSRNWCLCSHYPKTGNFLKLIFLTVVTTQCGEPERHTDFSSETLKWDFPFGHWWANQGLAAALLDNPGPVFSAGNAQWPGWGNCAIADIWKVKWRAQCSLLVYKLHP